MTPQELKNSILQLAIQGKLVEQRSEDGTAEELMTSVTSLSNNVNGQRVKQKIVAQITEDEKAFEIPEKWTWVKLGEVCVIARGGSPRPIKEYITTDADGVNWIKIGDTEKNGKYIQATAEKIKPSGVSKSRMVHVGDFLLTNSMSFGHPYILKVDGCIHDGWLVISQINKVFDQDYLYWMLSSNYAYMQFCGKASGAVVKNLNSDKVANSVFPLPPLAEQKRIVAKIEELLPYIDRYGQAWRKLEKFNSRFPEDMKKSLLQDAIQGKLVEQRPEEGTAEKLFAQIQQEKQRLIAEKKIKKEKPLPEITDDEKPFDIPQNWKWIRLGSILHYIDTGKSFKCDEIPPTGNKCGIIKVSAVTWGKFNENESKTCYSNESWVDAYEIHKNDFLICRANTAALVGGCVIVDKISKRLMLSDKVLRLHFTKMIYPFYVLWALRTPFVRNQFGSMATGTSESMKNISQDILKNTVIPLPPIPEQRRIVEKLEQLLPLCERLKGF